MQALRPSLPPLPLWQLVHHQAALLSPPSMPCTQTAWSAGWLPQTHATVALSAMFSSGRWVYAGIGPQAKMARVLLILQLADPKQRLYCVCFCPLGRSGSGRSTCACSVAAGSPQCTMSDMPAAIAFRLKPSVSFPAAPPFVRLGFPLLPVCLCSIAFFVFAGLVPFSLSLLLVFFA